MHKLNRPNAPACLNNYQHGTNNWSDLTHADRNEIWQQLDAMQARRCAYCEDALQDTSRHIEHFEQRSRSPQMTFAWSNLFGSCNKGNSCGKHKDRQQYNPRDIIKPDVDDPEDYLRFMSSGRIIPRNDLDLEDKIKAEETLRVFNLDHEHGSLRWKRHKAVIGYTYQAKEMLEFYEILEEDEFNQYKNEELDAISQLPFSTAIKHVLTEFLP